jgi:hypothetical protein
MKMSLADENPGYCQRRLTVAFEQTANLQPRELMSLISFSFCPSFRHVKGTLLARA